MPRYSFKAPQVPLVIQAVQSCALPVHNQVAIPGSHNAAAIHEFLPKLEHSRTELLDARSSGSSERIVNRSNRSTCRYCSTSKRMLSVSNQMRCRIFCIEVLVMVSIWSPICSRSLAATVRCCRRIDWRTESCLGSDLVQVLIDRALQSVHCLLTLGYPRKRFSRLAQKARHGLYQHNPGNRRHPAFFPKRVGNRFLLAFAGQIASDSSARLACRSTE